MRETTSCHLGHQCLVAVVECRELADPSGRFRMVAISALPERQNVPQAVELAMLREEVITAETSRIDVPDSHDVRGSMALSHTGSCSR